MKTIIAGSRTFDDYSLIRHAIESSPWYRAITEVVSGAQRSTRVEDDGSLFYYGVDYFGEQWARSKMIPIKRFPADWHQYGKSAGPRRNEQMACYADALIAVWDGQSRGTSDMIRRAREHGLDTYVFLVEVPHAS